jgi:hypothetical protein
MACPASANLELAIPNWQPPVVDDTPAASEGTRKHKMLEPIMALGPTDLEYMAKYIQYVADLRRLRRFTHVLVEQQAEAHWLKSKPKTTADLVLATQDELHVIDGKWGKIPVAVEHNVQGMFYALTYAHLAPKAKGATIHILQPPAGKYESWYASADVLAQFMADALKAEALVLAGDTTFGPSDSCTFCPANPHGRGSKGRPFCPAQMQMLYPDKTNEAEILAL